MPRHAWIAVFSLTLVGCGSCSGSSAGEGAPTASASIAAPAPSATPGASAAASPDEADVDMDPELLALARKAIRECGATWKDETGFDLACPAYRSFNNLRFELGRHDAGFVNMVDQPSPRLRLVGARKLAAWGKSYATSKELAARVLAVAEKDASPAYAGTLGFAVGKIDLDATGLGDRVKALALRKETSPAMREGLLYALAPNNRASAVALEVTKKLALESDDRQVRKAAVSGLIGSLTSKPAEVCATWLEVAKRDEEPIAADAMARLLGGQAWVVYAWNGFNASSSYPLPTGSVCSDELDKGLDVAEKRAKAGTAVDEGWTLAVKGVFQDTTKASAAQKKKAAAVAKAFAETTTNHISVRTAALRVLASYDPGGKAFASKFTSDDNAMMSAAAREIASGAAPQ